MIAEAAVWPRYREAVIGASVAIEAVPGMPRVLAPAPNPHPSLARNNLLVNDEGRITGAVEPPPVGQTAPWQ